MRATLRASISRRESSSPKTLLPYSVEGVAASPVARQHAYTIARGIVTVGGRRVGVKRSKVEHHCRRGPNHLRVRSASSPIVSIVSALSLSMLKGSQPSVRDVDILGDCSAASPNTTDNLAIDHDRDTAAQQGEARLL